MTAPGLTAALRTLGYSRDTARLIQRRPDMQKLEVRNQKSENPAGAAPFVVPDVLEIECDNQRQAEDEAAAWRALGREAYAVGYPRRVTLSRASIEVVQWVCKVVMHGE